MTELPTEMRAAVNAELNSMVVGTHPVPKAPPGGIVVRMQRAAICGSDLHSVYDGLGFLNAGFGIQAVVGRPGHEGVGMIAESDTPDLAVGTRVLTLGFGTFAEYVAMGAEEVIALEPDDDGASLLMAQQLGVVVYGMQRFWPEGREPADVVTIVGAGSIGLLFLQLARRAGFRRIVVSDIDERRLAAAAALGADVTVLTPRESVVDATLVETNGEGADLVIEAAGFDTARAECVHAVRLDGRIGYFGYPETFGESSYPFADAFWKAPISIEVVKGAQRLAGLPTFHEAIRLIRTGEVDVTPLLGAEFPLEQMQAAMDAARNRDAVKVQVLMG